MYKYKHPTPIVIKLTDEWGWGMRNKAAEYVAQNLNKTGAERGKPEEQSYGALVEYVIRSKLGMSPEKPDDMSLSYDLILPSGVKVDIKCRGGQLPFKELYDSNDDIPREAKHNLWARQLYEEKLDTDVYLLTHLETPKSKGKTPLPGTKRQKKWVLYVCGWVSKGRAIKDGVFLPRGALTEQGKKWFPYRGQEVEFYNQNLNGLGEIEDFLKIDITDVQEDVKRATLLNLTLVDSLRIVYDLIGRGVLKAEHADFIKQKYGLKTQIKPFLHPNQYFYVVRWLIKNGVAGEDEMKKLSEVMKEELYSGI